MVQASSGDDETARYVIMGGVVGVREKFKVLATHDFLKEWRRE